MSTFLEKHKRQPKLFIELPSEGQFYDDTVCAKVKSMPVFGMSAMDEILLKTPDALFSGEATYQVMQSCVPDILDPWQLIGYDIDYILLSIRIATYGENIDITTKCPKCTAEVDGTVSLTSLLQQVNEYETNYSFQVGELYFDLHPITYRQTTDFSAEHYTLQRQIMQASEVDLPQDEKDKYLNDLMLQSANLNLRIALAHINRITDGENEEADSEQIHKFVSENDLDFYTKVRDTIMEITQRWKLPKFDTTCGNEECNHTFKTNLDMDYSNFFGTRSLHSRNLIS
jgi:hypothetical protein